MGFHISIHGSIDVSVDRAKQLQCDTFQIFTRSPRQWISAKLDPKKTKAFSEKVKSFTIEPVFAHMPYLPNLSSPRSEVYKKSVKTLILELERCGQLKIPYLVTHLGSHLGKGKKIGFINLIDGINKALKEIKNHVILLLENTAGTKNSMGNSFEDIQLKIQLIARDQRHLDG